MDNPYVKKTAEEKAANKIAGQEKAKQTRMINKPRREAAKKLKSLLSDGRRPVDEVTAALSEVPDPLHYGR
jgi:hypothetical protein